MIRIKKAKINSDKKVVLAYEKQVRGGIWDEYCFTCSDQARPEFYQAIGKLAPYVVEMCELPEEYLQKNLVRGVSFSYGGADEQSYCPGSDGDEKQLLSDDCVRALDILCEEAELYIDGERAQGNLFSVA